MKKEKGDKEMKILVLLFHPDYKNSRINKRLVMELEKYDEITVRHIDYIYSDEKIDILAEQSVIEEYERIVFQFPLYWYSSPPLLKKWLDEVLTHGWAYGSKGKKLVGKQLLLAVTAGDAKESFTSTGAVKFTLEELLSPIQATSNIIGTQYLPPYLLYRVGDLTDEQLSEHTEGYIEYITNPSLR